MRGSDTSGSTSGARGPAPSVVIIGAGPPGSPPPTSSPSRATRHGPRGRLRWSAASAAPSSATAGASTSAATASSPRCSAVEALWHEILADEDFLLRPRQEPHLLPGQVLRLPAQAAQRPAQPRRPSRRCAACCSYALGPGAPAEGPVDARGLRRRQLRLAPLPPLLQDLQREALGRAGRRRSRPTGARSASRACRSFKAVWEPIRSRYAGRRRQGQAGHQPDRGVPVPEVRPRDDVGAVPRAGRGRRAPRSSLDTPVTRIRHERGRAVERGGRVARAVTTEYPADHVISSMPFSLLLAGDGSAGARPRCWPRPTACAFRDFLTVALVVPGRQGAVGRQLDLHPRPRGQDHARPELRLVVAVPGEGRAQRASVSSTSCTRATSSWTAHRRRPRRPGHPASSSRSG